MAQVSWVAGDIAMRYSFRTTLLIVSYQKIVMAV